MSVTIYLTLATGGILLVWLWRGLMRACEAANGANWGSRWLNRLDGLNRILCRRFHHLRHDPLKLPARGGALVASNHISGLDPLLLIAASPRPLRFLIAREEYERWWLRWLLSAVGCIPIERTRDPLLSMSRFRRLAATFRLRLQQPPSASGSSGRGCLGGNRAAARRSRTHP